MPLTAYREYYDHKVEDVPRLGEVVLPQRKYLEDALSGKDDDESHVQVVEGEVPHIRLAVVIERHGPHVERDENHYDHVELLVRNDAEHDGLRLPLWMGIKFKVAFFHPPVHNNSLPSVWVSLS